LYSGMAVSLRLLSFKFGVCDGDHGMYECTIVREMLPPQ
jgi:hypothetical protein